MQTKKTLLIITIFSILLSFIGCSSEAKEPKVEQTPEQKFIEVFEKEINNRWTETNKLDSKNLDETSYKENLIKIIEAEVNALKVVAEPLTDVQLKEIANNYIEGTLSQIESFKTNDYELMWQYQEKANNLRKPALITLVDTYKVNINEEHQQTYKDFKEAATIINQENEARKYAEKLALEMKFEKIEDEYGGISYETVIENTSNITFDSLSFTIKCKDKDGIVVSTDYIYLNSFTPGTKEKAKVFAYEDNIDTLAVTVNNFYLE